MRRSSRPFLAVALAVAAAIALAAPATSAIGTDPGLAQQWGLRQIGAPSAWSTSVGAGVPIAVIDTGIDKAHPDLRDQIDAAVTCLDTGGDPRRCTVDGADIHGHGSHVAGIAAAAANDLGVSGVAPGARIIAVRVFSYAVDPITGKRDEEPGADALDIMAGIRWVTANVPRKGVINISIGDGLIIKTFENGYEDGIDEAWSAGWLPVTTAGNARDFGLTSEEYGNLNALVVGATGPDGELAAYSSPFGSAKWGLVAPGGNARSGNGKGACQNEPAKCVLSTYVGGEYGLLQGTSMAAPHVAGAAALLMASGLDHAAAVQRLLATTDKSKDCGSGCKGRLDAAAAVAGLPVSAGASGGATPSSPAATEPPSASSGPSSPPTTAAGGTRPRTSVPGPAPTSPPSVVETTAPPVETTVAEGAAEAAATGDDAVVGITLDEAARAAGDGGADSDPDADDVPPGPALVAVVAIAGVATTTLLAWRRRWST